MRRPASVAKASGQYAKAAPAAIKTMLNSALAGGGGAAPCVPCFGSSGAGLGGEDRSGMTPAGATHRALSNMRLSNLRKSTAVRSPQNRTATGSAIVSKQNENRERINKAAAERRERRSQREQARAEKAQERLQHTNVQKGANQRRLEELGAKAVSGTAPSQPGGMPPAVVSGHDGAVPKRASTQADGGDVQAKLAAYVKRKEAFQSRLGTMRDNRSATLQARQQLLDQRSMKLAAKASKSLTQGKQEPRSPVPIKDVEPIDLVVNTPTAPSQLLASPVPPQATRSEISKVADKAHGATAE